MKEWWKESWLSQWFFAMHIPELLTPPLFSWRSLTWPILHAYEYTFYLVYLYPINFQTLLIFDIYNHKTIK